MQKVIITAAICGAEVTKEHNPNVPYTIEEIHASMDEAESDFIAGRVYAHEDVMQEMREYIMTL